MPTEGEPPGVADDERAPRAAWATAAREDLAACTDAGLHWLVAGIFVVAMGATGTTVALLSEAFYTSGDLSGTIELLSTNAAWLFTSLVALVGLFVAVPGHLDDRDRRVSPDQFLGWLVGRSVLVAAGALAGCVAVLAVGSLAYASFSPTAFVAFALATTGLAVAYTSIGVTVTALASTPARVVGWLLAVYFVLVFVWNTWIAPLGILLVASGGQPDALAARPGWFDVLVSTSPGGAYGTLGQGIAEGSVGALEAFAAVALIAWIVVPAAVGSLVARL